MKLKDISIGMLVATKKTFCENPVKGAFRDWRIGYIVGLSYKYSHEVLDSSVVFNRREDSYEVIPTVLFVGDSVPTSIHSSNLYKLSEAGF